MIYGAEVKVVVGKRSVGIGQRTVESPVQVDGVASCEYQGPMQKGVRWSRNPKNRSLTMEARRD